MVDTAQIQQTHKALFPSYAQTPVRLLPQLAAELGVKAVYVKDESRRFGLPAFKILGASWGICNLLGERWGVEPWDIDGIRRRATENGGMTIYTATDGNHGRAVARTCKLLGLSAGIFVPSTVEQWSIEAIESEGASVTKVESDYDGAVMAARVAADADPKGELVQDMGWEGYEDVPARIVDGYQTIAHELASQLPYAPTAVVVPVGVGSLAHAIVQYYASTSTRILSAEPDAAPCLSTSLKAGKPTTVPTRFTSMAGLNCGSITTGAWEDLKRAIQPEDALVVTDQETARAMDDLAILRVPVGPCGAAPLAAARKAKFAEDDVVVLICTEGPPGSA